MKETHLCKCAPALGAVLSISIISASASPVARDSFPLGNSPADGEYEAGIENLVGQEPATLGFTGPWITGFGTSPDVAENSLTFQGVSSAGGAIEYFNQDGRYARVLETGIDDTFSGTIYLGFLFQPFSIESGYGAFELHDSSGGTAFDDNTDRSFQIAFGEPAGGLIPAGSFGVRINDLNIPGGDDAVGAELGPVADEAPANLFIVRFDFSSEPVSDSVTVYFNPEDLSDENANTGVTLSGFDLRFDAVSLARFGGDESIFDEIRFATAFAEVVTDVDTDTDMDGIDDGYEELNGLTVGIDDSQGDALFDNDGLVNIDEFRAGTNPNVADTDMDGIGDREEVDGTGNLFNGLPTIPTLSDSDGDLISDGDEVGSENGFVTNPNARDTDGDMEDDNLELFQNTDPLDRESNAAALGLIVADGTRDALYGEPLAVQTIETGFGDNLSEWNAAYARINDGRLALLLTGNMENNFNKLNIFIDSVDGGTNVLTTAGNDGSDVMNGLVFDSEFTPEYHFIARRSDGQFDLDFADLATGTFASYMSVFGNSGEGISATGDPADGATLSPLPPPIAIGYNNSNEAGVGGSTGIAADQDAARAVTTGLEIEIALADIGNPSGEFRICVMQNSGDQTFLSNQFLGGLPVGTDNLGTPSVVDLSALEGDQFFTVLAPDSIGSFLVTAVSFSAAGDEITIEWESIPGESYQVETSTTLTDFTPLGDPITGAADATVTETTIPVNLSENSRQFYRVTR